MVERQAEVDREREAQKDKDGDVQIVEQQPDVPLRIANIEGMVRQLASLGDEEIGQHRSVVGEMLGQLDGMWVILSEDFLLTILQLEWRRCVFVWE